MAKKLGYIPRYPKDYRKDILNKVSKILRKGESIQLVGGPGAAKSDLVKLISQIPEIKNRYFPSGGKVKIIIFDANTLLERSSLTASRLLLSLFCFQDVIPMENVGVNEKLIDNIRKTCSTGKLILVIDHIQEIDYPEYKLFFTNLSFIYKKFRPNICFLFISKNPIIKPEDLVNFGGLKEILLNKVIFVPPLNKKDSLWFIDDVVKLERALFSLSESKKVKIYKASNGYPRTMKRIVESVKRGFSVNEIIESPKLDPALALHLEELKNAGDLVKESPIMSNYEKNLVENEGENVGSLKFRKKLTKLEERLLKLFLSRKGELISREEGIDSLWGRKAVGISDHAYDQIIHRLRGKLADTKPKTGIETIRGRGHTFRVFE